MLKPRKAVQSIPAYHPPLAGRDGLRLDFNENTNGCSPRVLNRLRSLGPEDLAKYPERDAVEAQIAAFFKVAPSKVLLTNGVDEAIHLLCQTYLESGDEALIVVPTYSMYRIYATSAGAKVIAIPAKNNFEFPASELIQRVSDRTRLICIANPNNPTGAVASTGDLIQIVRSAPSAAVLVDEAYVEYYGKTFLDHRQDLPNVFIARTFSKVYGLAGLRIGVLVGDAEQMSSLRLVASPYNVNAAALACLPEAVADQMYVSQYVSEIREVRSRLESILEAAGIKFWRSEANFILMRIGPSKAQAASFVESMRSRGILVRDRSSDYGCEGCVRITVGTENQADRLFTALQASFEELGIAQGASRP